MNIEEMIGELAEYYECAGFADVYNRVLKDMSEEGILKLYRETFDEEEIERERVEAQRPE